MDADAVRAAVNEYFSALGNADEDGFTRLFSDDVWFCDPLGTPILEGHAGVAKFLRGLRRSWSSFSAQTQAVHVRGPRAAASWSAKGLSATGKNISFDGIDVFEMADDGTIQRVEGYWDLESVVGQM